MKNILCYGDSNTWGFIVGSLDLTTGYMERYPRHIRWTGQLQKLLGHNYFVIEEGLCGRNTNIGNPPEFGGESCNGKSYLQPCLSSHAPLNWVVLMLGANDFKATSNRSAENVAAGLEELIQIIQSSTYGPDMKSPPRILLIGYPFLNTQNGLFADIFLGADDKSKSFPALCAKIAKDYSCAYLDMSQQVALSKDDGLHLDEGLHVIFAKLIAEKILQEEGPA
ncbi:MAG: SGNH/GDSL hydrolase family protein [Gammaproteobacteria bacterium]|nr:SGNH/GDSL hydrolase family protein [Gammaproteobacteria bacterium]